MIASAAAFAVAAGGSAFAQSTYTIGNTLPGTAAATPTLTGGDDAFIDAVVTTAKGVTFTNDFTFNLASVGPSGVVDASINNISVKKYSGQPSLSGLTAYFYDLSKNGALVGTFTEASLEGGNATVDLTSGQDYKVVVSGQATSQYGGSYMFDVATAPVPGPTGFLVAIAGMGGLLLMRLQASRRLTA